MAEMIPVEIITKKILIIRGRKVILDRDIAELYGVETRVINQAVRRNINRFPKDFMFQLSKKEFENWKSQIVISKPSLKMGLRKAPLAFTEEGVAMLSSVLNSKKAIEINILIMRAFVQLRKIFFENEILKYALEGLKKQVSANSYNTDIIDPVERYKDTFQRCLKLGKEALIVKATDIFDNFSFFIYANKELETDLSNNKYLLSKNRYFSQVAEPIIKETEIFNLMLKRIEFMEDM